MATVPMAIPKTKDATAKTKDAQCPILLPHEVGSHVHHHHATWFSSLYIGEQNEQDTPGKFDDWRPGKIQSYWSIP